MNYAIPAEVLKIARPVIAHFECPGGAHLDSYICKGEEAGTKNAQATIGYGRAIPLFKHPMSIDQEIADKWFSEDIQVRYNKFVTKVPAKVIAKMTAAQIAAFLSWSYNAVSSSWTSDSFRKLCNGDVLGWIDGADEWDNNDMAGLVRRRAVERHLVERGELALITGPLNWYMDLIPQVAATKKAGKTGHLTWKPDHSKLYWKAA